MVALSHIRKRFGAVAALDGVTFDVRPGEIHALLGENGAGKSTLMRILFGLLRPDSGEIQVDGRPVALRGPRDARRLGIGMVHQHFMLVERMTVAENVLLGDGGGPFWRRSAALEQRVAEAAGRLGLSVDPAAIVEDLSVGERQRVELLKVLKDPVRLLILDEPTAVLTPAESESLFATLRRLRDGGCGVVFISHKLDEVLRLCDRVSVLRRGRTVYSSAPSQTTAAELTEQMIMGARTDQAADGAMQHRRQAAGIERADDSAVPGRGGSALLTLRGASTPPREGRVGLRGVDLEVAAGEVVGVAGVEGNGQSALIHAALGFDAPSSGVVERRFTRAGFIAEDRHREALALPLSLAENLVLAPRDQARFARLGLINWRGVRRHARAVMDSFAIRARGPQAAMAELSGGNQQKLVAARELAREPDFVVAANPTRGLDVGATEFVRRKLLDQARHGAGVLLVSSDLDEIMDLSDRVVVAHRGELRPARSPRDAAHIAALMTGAAS